MGVIEAKGEKFQEGETGEIIRHGRQLIKISKATLFKEELPGQEKNRARKLHKVRKQKENLEAL